jgi:ParB family transcriptional regulator, chromosome partitioning protein
MSLRDKASKVNFSFLPGAQPPPEEGAVRPKTAPGAMMAFAADQRSDLLRENESLRERAAQADELKGKLDEAMADLGQWDQAKPTRLLEPGHIRPSRFANRHESSFRGADFEALRSEIKEAGGNIQPIKVRPLAKPEGDVRYEIIFGHRRFEACRQLSLPVLAVVDSVDDRTLFAEMDRENRARKDLSPWEQGVMYRRALTEGLYPSNRKMAEALGVDLSGLGRTLMLADLPAEVVAAFASPLDLQFRWAKPLADAASHDLAGLKKRAESIAALPQRPSSKAIFEMLVGKGRGVERFHPPAPVQVQVAGKHAATIAFTAKGGTSVEFQPGFIPPERAAEFAAVITEFLRGS